MLTLSDYWLNGDDDPGIDMIERIIARLNESDFVNGCVDTLEPPVTGTTWCYEYDFEASAGDFVPWPHLFWASHPDTNSEWDAGVGFISPPYENPFSVSESIIVIKAEFLDAFPITAAEVWAHRPSNSNQGDGIRFNSGSTSAVVGDYTTEHALFTFDPPLVGSTFHFGFGSDAPDSSTILDRGETIYKVRFYGNGTPPIGPSNCAA